MAGGHVPVLWAGGSHCPFSSREQPSSLPASGSEVIWGWRGLAAEGCFRTEQLLGRQVFIRKTGRTQALGLSLIPCSECLPPALSPRTQELPACSSKPPESRTQTQSPNSSWQKQPCSQAPTPRNQGQRACAPRTRPRSLSSLYCCWGEGVAPLADPSTAQLPASLISIRYSPSVTTATSCSAPSGVTAPAILVKGRPVHCPVSHSSAQPDLRVLSACPPPPPPGPETSAPSSSPAPLPYAPPHVRLWHQPLLLPLEKRLAVMDGITNGPFPGYFIWLLLGLLSLLQEASGGRRWGSQDPQKEMLSRGLGSRMAGFREKDRPETQHQGTRKEGAGTKD